MMEIETTQPTVEELQVKVTDLTARLERMTGTAAGKESMLEGTVQKIAELAKETFGTVKGYPDFVQEVYEQIDYPIDSKWLRWASVARDVDVELEYEVSVSGYVGVSGAYVDVDGELPNVTVSATLKDVPGEITDVSSASIDDVSDYSEFEQEYEFSEGQLTVELTLVGIHEQ